jgi:peptidase inhibitor family I36/beta/gamma crystallin
MRHLTAAGCFSLFLIGAGPASAQTWGRPPTPATGACFYENRNFTGQYFCVRINESSASVPVGTNDRISSIRIFGTAEVIVYKDVNFHGSSKRFDYNIADLREEGWNDKISSFSVGSHGYAGGGGWGGSQTTSGACFYEHPNYDGRYFCANIGASTPEVPEGTNDKISSIRLFGNASVRVWQDARYGGREQQFDRDVRNLGSLGWDDLISSYRVAGRGGGNWGGGSGGGQSRGLQVYADINYKGRSATLDPSTPDVGARGMGATISSFRVPSGETWQVCTETNFRGRCQNFTGDASDLRRGDWNDLIASVRRIR